MLQRGGSFRMAHVKRPSFAIKDACDIRNGDAEIANGVGCSG